METASLDVLEHHCCSRIDALEKQTLSNLSLWNGYMYTSISALIRDGGSGVLSRGSIVRRFGYRK